MVCVAESVTGFGSQTMYPTDPADVGTHRCVAIKVAPPTARCFRSSAYCSDKTPSTTLSRLSRTNPHNKHTPTCPRVTRTRSGAETHEENIDTTVNRDSAYHLPQDRGKTVPLKCRQTVPWGPVGKNSTRKETAKKAVVKKTTEKKPSKASTKASKSNFDTWLGSAEKLSKQATWKKLPQVAVEELLKVLAHNDANPLKAVPQMALLQRFRNEYGVNFTRGAIDHYLQTEHGRRWRKTQ